MLDWNGMDTKTELPIPIPNSFLKIKNHIGYFWILSLILIYVLFCIIIWQVDEIFKNTPVQLRVINYKNAKPLCRGYIYKNCNCVKHLHTVFSSVVDEPFVSTCSYEADLHGPEQKIISYTLFDPNEHNEGNINDNLEDFTEGLYPNLSQIKKLYPDWFVRIYSNFNLTQEYCKIACMDHVFWCDIRNSTVPSLEFTNARVWRFLPLGDPTVDIFLSRDIDSYIIQREVEIVEDWLNNYPEKGFHCARDSGTHNFREILAGIWGARNSILKYEFARTIRDKILRRSENNFKRETDEQLLKKIIFYPHRDKVLQHDSYLCTQQYPDAVPYPKQRPHPRIRIAQAFRNYARYISQECPVECRPPHGKNWTYC